MTTISKIINNPTRLKTVILSLVSCLLLYVLIVPRNINPKTEQIKSSATSSTEMNTNSALTNTQKIGKKTSINAQNQILMYPGNSFYDDHKKNKIKNIPDTEEAARAAQAALHAKFPARTTPLPLQHQQEQLGSLQNQHPHDLPLDNEIHKQTGRNPSGYQTRPVYPKNVEDHHPASMDDAITIDPNTGLPLPFPVYRKSDNKVPGPAGHVNAASEILECREHVIEFVIHASDVKDECEGLRRAYDVNCLDLTSKSISTVQSNAVLSSPISNALDLNTLNNLQTRDTGGRARSRFLSTSEELNYNDYRLLTRSKVLMFDQLSKVWENMNLSFFSFPKSENKAGTRRILQEAAMQAQANALLHANDGQSVAPNFFENMEAEEVAVCCSSIMNVFHEHCEHNEEDELNDSRLFVIVAVIAICLLVKSLIKTFQIRWLPEAAGCILVGVFGGLILEFVPHMDFSFDEKFFLRVMLPPIVFQAALDIDKKAFLRHVIPITLYAVLGTMLSTVLTALIVYHGSHFFDSSHCPDIPLVDSLTFGALISSIDPVAILSVLTTMGMANTDTLYVIVFGESLLNDGVAIVLFDTLVHFLDNNLVIDSQAVFDAWGHFVVVAFGSVFVGLLSGACCTAYFWAMRGCHSALVEVLTFFCWALLPFYICDGIGWSGIVAIVAAGFVMDLLVVGMHDKPRHVLNDIEENIDSENMDEVTGTSHILNASATTVFKQKGHLSDQARRHVGFVTEINATLMETAIFAYLGLFLLSYRYHWNLLLSVIAIIACVLSRAIMVPLLSTLANYWMKTRMAKQRSRNESKESNIDADDNTLEKKLLVIDRPLQIVLLFSGLRGAMSFALVENIPLFDTVTGHGSKLKPELKSMTSASIVFTVFILGGSTNYLMDYLGFNIKKDDETIELTTKLMNSKAQKKSDDETYNEDKEKNYKLHPRQEQNKSMRHRTG